MHSGRLTVGEHHGTHQNVKYTLKISPASDNMHPLHLQLPGMTSQFWKLACEDDLGELQGTLEQELEAAATMLADGQSGWPVEQPQTLREANLNLINRWVYSQLDREGTDYQTGWITCHCGNVASRFRRKDGRYTLNSRAQGVDWHEVTIQVISNSVMLPPMMLSRIMSEQELSAAVHALIDMTRADPAMELLALEAPTFELPCRDLVHVSEQLRNESNEMHEHVNTSSASLEALMTTHVGPVFAEVSPVLAQLREKAAGIQAILHSGHPFDPDGDETPELTDTVRDFAQLLGRMIGDPDLGQTEEEPDNQGNWSEEDWESLTLPQMIQAGMRKNTGTLDTPNHTATQMTKILVTYVRDRTFRNADDMLSAGLCVHLWALLGHLGQGLPGHTGTLSDEAVAVLFSALDDSSQNPDKDMTLHSLLGDPDEDDGLDTCLFNLMVLLHLQSNSEISSPLQRPLLLETLVTTFKALILTDQVSADDVVREVLYRSL